MLFNHNVLLVAKLLFYLLYIVYNEENRNVKYIFTMPVIYFMYRYICAKIIWESRENYGNYI